MTAVRLAGWPQDERADVRWLCSAALALAMHLGLAAALAASLLVSDDGMSPAPAVIVELVALPVAPPAKQELAFGPPMQEAPPPRVEKVSEPLPRQESAASNAELTPQIKPAPQVETSQADRPPAPRTTAPPRTPTPAGAAPAAPSPGAASAKAAPASWIDQLFSHLMRHRHYPSAARVRREEGVVTVNFTMSRDGRVLSRRITRSSGHPALDEEALALLARAQPLPPFPPGMPGASRSFSAPIKFSLR